MVVRNKYVSVFLKFSGAVVIAATLASCGEGEDRQLKYLERAQTFFAEENYDKARIEARNVLQINPKNVEARIILGDISYADGDIRRAFGMFLSVLEDEPDNVSANLSLAEIYLGVRDFDRVIEYANKVLNVDAENYEAMGVKAIALAESGDAEQGRALAERVLESSPANAAALAVLVQMHIRNEEPASALGILETAQDISPDDIKIAKMKITVLQSMGNKNQVEAELKKLVAKYPEDDSYVTTLANFYIREARIEDARAVLINYAESKPGEVDPRLAIIAFRLKHDTKEVAIEQVREYINDYPEESKYRIALAQIHLFTGERTKAEAVLAEAIDANDQNVASIEARNMLVGIYLQEGEIAKAKAMIQDVLELEPENVSSLIARARMSIDEGQTREGIADLRTVLKNDPESVAALKLLARAQEREGNNELALDNYKKLITLQKPDLQTLAGAARLAIAGRHYQDAENYIRIALEQDANNAALVTNLVRLLALKEDWETAQQFIQQLIESDESAALGYFLEGGLKARTNDINGAIESYQKSIAIEPKAVETLTALTQMIIAENGIKKAIAYVGTHCENNPELAHCFYTLGSLRAQDKDLDGAIVELEKSLDINSGFVASYRQLAKVYRVQANKSAAENILMRGIDATSSQVLMFELAGFYVQTDAYEAARDIYLSMLETNPDNLAVKNNLAMIYVENLNTPENVRLARGLIADLQDSENPAYLDTVGWVFYLSGDYGQAVTYLQAAVDQVGQSPLLQYHLGMALYRYGDAEGAKRHLQIAVNDPDAEYIGIDTARETLAELQQTGAQ